MNSYRQPQPSRMLLALASTGQSYPQTNTFSLLGTHAINGKELREMQRGQINQGIENAVATNLVACMRLRGNASALRIRPYLIAGSDPSGVSVKIGLSLYPKFPGDKQAGEGQGLVAPTVDDTARTAGIRGDVTLTGKATSVGSFTVNPLTGEAWPTGIVAGSHGVYPVVGATLNSGAFGRLLSLEGFTTGNPDSGFILIDPSFNEYLIAKVLTIATPATVLGVLLAIDSDS